MPRSARLKMFVPLFCSLFFKEVVRTVFHAGFHGTVFRKLGLLKKK